MNHEVLIAIDETTQELLDTIQSFSQQEFNTIPFEGSWTPGQVAEHLYKSESGITRMFRGNTREANRPADQLAAQMRDIFMDFTTKMKSPESIVPTKDDKDRDDLYEKHKRNRVVLRQIISGADLNLILTDFALPKFGELTGFEWCTFLLAHSRRHIHQLKNIRAALNAKSQN